MKQHASFWIVAAILAVVVAGHGVILYYVWSHMAVSMMVTAFVAVVVVKHLGLMGPLYALLRKSLRRTGTE
jgi:hypothetical protein